MERRFKIGDRVYDKTFGDGTVVHFDSEMYVVDFDEPTDCLNDCNGHSNNGQGLWIRENHLTPIATNSYYYEEVTRNGRQWFRISPKGEWMPKPETVEQKYDRAGMATAAMKGLIQGITWIDEGGIICNRPQEVAEIAVTYADALIAELQRTEK
jgi:hypothetical protein